jgi:agmatinase
LSRIPDLPRYYLTMDIDVLDPSLAPGTGSPEPDGLPYRYVKQIVSEVAERFEIVGFDLVEVNPYLDPAQVTALVGARLAVETIGAIFHGRTGELRRNRHEQDC